MNTEQKDFYLKCVIAAMQALAVKFYDENRDEVDGYRLSGEAFNVAEHMMDHAQTIGLLLDTDNTNEQEDSSND